MDLVHADEFFAIARERYQIKLNREARKPFPWTTDPIFQTWRFCNVHREDDRTTVWFRDSIREPLRGAPKEKILQATMIFRWFNRIQTGELIKDLLLDNWDTEEARRRLKNEVPVVTGAFIIKGPDGFNKLDGVLYCVDHAIPRLADFVRTWEQEGACLQNAWADLTEVYYLGPFMAYEIVTDLRWTPVLDQAIDICTWTNIGPGAARGMSYVVGEDLLFFNSNSVQHQVQMLALSRELLALSKDSAYWPQEWTPWEMREVEHWLCEMAKYVQARNGKKLKRRFA